MKNSLRDIEVIERYFDSALTAAEQEELSRRLKSDAEFRNLFERERSLISAIRFQGFRADLEYLKEVEGSLSEPRTRSYRLYWYSLAAAACVAVLALMLIFPAGDDTNKLFQAYFQPYPNVFEPTVRGSGTATSRAKAFQAYEQGDYKLASSLFEQLVSEKKEPGMLLLLGNANLMLNKTDEARANFNDLLRNYDDLDIDATWYLGLVSLKTGDKEKAVTYFKDVASSENTYAAKAREIIEKMK